MISLILTSTGKLRYQIYTINELTKQGAPPSQSDFLLFTTVPCNYNLVSLTTPTVDHPPAAGELLDSWAQARKGTSGTTAKSTTD